MDKNKVTYDKAYKFALRIVNAYKYLIEEKKEFVLSKQLLRSGTSIGAIIAETSGGQHFVVSSKLRPQRQNTGFLF